MRVLRQGSTGSDVTEWQNFLIGQGFYFGVADDKYGPKTVTATQAFQSNWGLDVDGAVGRNTLAQALTLGFGDLEDTDDSENSPNWPPKPDFNPLNAAERIQLFGGFKYEAAPTSDNPEAIVIRDGWEAKNIVKVVIPQLIGVKGAPKDGKVQFHRAAAPQFQALWAAWEAAGLLRHILTWSGSFAPRFIRGSRTTLSNHSMGTAFDVNVVWNALGAQPALVHQPGSVRKLIPIANEHGFYWGGHYTSRKDGMHLEIAKLVG